MRTNVTYVHQEKGLTAVEVGQSIFHPRGGGQPGDAGHLTKIIPGSHQHFRVVDTRSEDGRLLHFLDAPTLDLVEGDAVEVVRDEGRHQKLTRMHTGEHILFGALKRVVKDAVVDKVELDEHESSIFVKADNLSIDHLIAAERLANQIVRENRSVISHRVDKGSVHEVDGVRIRPERIKEDTVRILEVKDFDKSACCGTHVSRTREIGPLLVTKFNTVKKGFYEVRFKLDPVDDLFLFADIARRVRVLTNFDYGDITHGIKNLLAEREVQKAKIRELSANVHADIAEETVDGLTFAYAVFPGINKRDFVDKINAVNKPDTVFCFVNDGERPTIAVRSTSPQNYNAAELLKQLFLKIEGQGGGGPQLAQGSYQNATVEEVFSAVRELLQ
ncbi:hypothetical protein HZB03_02605 [Candidatus Woesearchaeota archaeon]|nr:hypothetical protein [Candidatus Woesearchaeota archaeon]